MKMVRWLSWVLGLTSASCALLAGCNQVLGIGDPQLDTTVTGGAGGTGGVGGVTTTGGGGSGGELPPLCHPDAPICNQVESDCLALEDNSEKDVYGLRIQSLDIWKPDAFATDPEYTAVMQSLTMNLPECYLQGGGTINWILELDTTTDTAKFGASKPIEDLSDGYTFVDEIVEFEPGIQFNVAPAFLSATVDDQGTIAASVAESIVMPIYLDQAATMFILLPIRKARIYDATISADRNCIGTHNAEGLILQDGCLPDFTNGPKAFLHDAKFDGYILLEEADDVIVEIFGLNRSLCVILAQDSAEYSDMGDPEHCNLLDGKIKFPGDWCSTTNSGATPSCHDAVYLGSALAASGVKINP
ncbi:MAG: hypothetical protein DRI90_06170 [Deltaproteobacteria bacterium]|nr:MAG: hypothetical protein DRI90_06170 [Deltaproteobacteria bacterium]